VTSGGARGPGVRRTGERRYSRLRRPGAGDAVEGMSTVQRRVAARANQRAAAFIRFQMLGDHEAMHILLTELSDDDTMRLAFVTALASIAATIGTQSMGRDGTLRYLRLLAENSAALSDADDIDSFFDDGPGSGAS